MDPPMTAASQPARLLTPREHEVMHWVSQGKSNWEVAKILGCVEQTVNKHLQRIYRKLGVELRFPIAVPGFPSAIRLFVLTHSRRKVRSRQRPHGRGQCFTCVRQRSEDSGQRTDIWKTVGDAASVPPKIGKQTAAPTDDRDR